MSAGEASSGKLSGKLYILTTCIFRTFLALQVAPGLRIEIPVKCHLYHPPLKTYETHSTSYRKYFLKLYGKCDLVKNGE